MIRLLHFLMSLLIAVGGFCALNLFLFEHYAYGAMATALVIYLDFIQCTVIKTHMEQQRWTN